MCLPGTPHPERSEGPCPLPSRPSRLSRLYIDFLPLSLNPVARSRLHRRGERMPGVQARLRAEHKRRYLDLDPTAWYQVVPIFPGVTQRMVNMAGERLARLSTPRGFVT